MRFNELAASQAAEAVGLSPPAGVSRARALVVAFIDGETLTEAAVREPDMLARIVPVMSALPPRDPQGLRGPVAGVLGVSRRCATTPGA